VKEEKDQDGGKEEATSSSTNFPPIRPNPGKANSPTEEEVHDYAGEEASSFVNEILTGAAASSIAWLIGLTATAIWAWRAGRISGRQAAVTALRAAERGAVTANCPRLASAAQRAADAVEAGRPQQPNVNYVAPQAPRAPGNIPRPLIPPPPPPPPRGASLPNPPSSLTSSRTTCPKRLPQLPASIADATTVNNDAVYEWLDASQRYQGAGARSDISEVLSAIKAQNAAPAASVAEITRRLEALRKRDTVEGEDELKVDEMRH
jgi:hypothetical protein